MFHDEKLSKINDEAKLVIDEYHSKLDRISSDIKNLEKTLQNLGIGEFEMVVDFEKIADDRVNEKSLSFRNSRLCYNNSPLIEQKSLIRIEIYKYLPSFFNACLEKIKRSL